MFIYALIYSNGESPNANPGLTRIPTQSFHTQYQKNRRAARGWLCAAALACAPAGTVYTDDDGQSEARFPGPAAMQVELLNTDFGAVKQTMRIHRTPEELYVISYGDLPDELRLSMSAERLCILSGRTPNQPAGTWSDNTSPPALLQSQTAHRSRSPHQARLSIRSKPRSGRR